jgi:micrococcal nuclease
VKISVNGKEMKNFKMINLVIVNVAAISSMSLIMFLAESSAGEIYFSCKGKAECFSGKVDRIVDGDTLYIEGVKIRLALIDAPESGESGFLEAKRFAGKICPVGSTALVDEDDGQTQKSHGRTIAVVYCGKYNLNEEILKSGHAGIYKRFCSVSEFSNEPWAYSYCKP